MTAVYLTHSILLLFTVIYGVVLHSEELADRSSAAAACIDAGELQA